MHIGRGMVQHIIIFLLFLLPSLLVAQKQDEKLAQEYFRQGEYEKALPYYERLYASNPLHISYYYGLYECYVALKQYGHAEKLALKQYKQTEDLVYMIDAGRACMAGENQAKAEGHFKEVIKRMLPVQAEIIKIYQAFLNNKLYDYALMALEKGRKMLGKDQYLLNNYFAQLYFLQQKYDVMLKEYFDLLLIHESFLSSVENMIENAIMQSTEPDKLKQQLEQEIVKYIQQYPDKTIFSEMLIWYYMQQNNYRGAVMQAKALDKRLKESGNRLLSIGSVAMQHKDYAAAEEAFRYVVNKGKGNPNYYTARFNLVQAGVEKIKDNPHTSSDTIYLLQSDFEQLMGEVGVYNIPSEFVQYYCELLAFYALQSSKAIDFLNNYIVNAPLNGLQKAALKILLADLYLYFDDMWEASLLYSQVEKDFKYESIGETAKFKNALIAYYAGDFKWAKAQLDVLKSATSKLVSNDAMELSMLIYDNLSVDTNTVPLFLFARAQFYRMKKSYHEALRTLDSLITYFYGHTLTDDVMLEKARIYKMLHQPDSVVYYYSRIVAEYPYEITADDALFECAVYYHHTLKQPEKAMEMYKQLFMHFPLSVHVADARENYRRLRGDNVYEEINKQLQKNP